MFLKNSSKREWLGYDTGIQKVDIKAESTFEVPDEVASVILRGLGCEAWITKTEAPKKKVKEVQTEDKSSKKSKK